MYIDIVYIILKDHYTITWPRYFRKANISLINASNINTELLLATGSTHEPKSSCSWTLAKVLHSTCKPMIFTPVRLSCERGRYSRLIPHIFLDEGSWICFQTSLTDTRFRQRRVTWFSLKHKQLHEKGGTCVCVCEQYKYHADSKVFWRFCSLF